MTKKYYVYHYYLGCAGQPDYILPSRCKLIARRLATYLNFKHRKDKSLTRQYFKAL